MHPPIDPYDGGRLDTGDGHSLYWEVCGNPAGRPALVLHGGPGSGCSPNVRRYFDPARYRVVLFDQRGAGRSTPHASDPAHDLATNTTRHLLGDIEALRERLGIARWLVYGVSWGSTLALAYARHHRERVTGLVLASVATTTAREIDWITRGVGAFVPEAWERFRNGVPADRRDGCLVDAYRRLLADPDPEVRAKAARDWCDWEMAIVAVHAGHRPDPRYEDAAFRLGFARLVTHYWHHRAWLAEDELLRAAPALAGIPGVLIHGRLDISGPLVTPWQLHRAWPGSRLVPVGGAGHDTRDPGMADAILAALDGFADG
ncbi:MAG: prolyl aminopeptidase [Thalassobaculales bacterium]